MEGLEILKVDEFKYFKSTIQVKKSVRGAV